jgi:hypothetical protein
VTDCRTPPRFLRRGLLAAAAACALGGPAAADPVPSRDYPPTYSSKKAPWYDPLHIFTASEKKFLVPAGGDSRPIPNEQVEPGNAATPAWKWYGYGTPTPGRNPLAPAGSYPAVPPTWYTTSGTTPGAIPTGQYGTPPAVPGVVPDPLPLPRMPAGPVPSIALSPPDGTAVPPAPSADGVDWKSAPATLRMPFPATPASTSGPRATLMAPVRDDGPPAAPAPPTAQPRTPLQRELPSSESPDIPVEAAPGIVAPGAGGVSQVDHRVTARALAPSADLAPAVRRACGADVRVMEVTPIGPKRLLVRLAGTVDAALIARDRLSQVPELAGWRLDFDLVTPLR